MKFEAEPGLFNRKNGMIINLSDVHVPERVGQWKKVTGGDYAKQAGEGIGARSNHCGMPTQVKDASRQRGIGGAIS